MSGLFILYFDAYTYSPVMRLPLLISIAVVQCLSLSACHQKVDDISQQSAPVASNNPAPTASVPVDPHSQPMPPASTPGAGSTPTTPPASAPSSGTPMPPASSTVPPQADSTCYGAGAPHRLSQVQYTNILSEFVSTMTRDSALASTVPNVVTAIAQSPPDVAINPDSARHEGFYRIDQAVTKTHVAAIAATAQSLAKSMTGMQGRMDAMLGQCSSGGDACITAFIKKAGRILMRKPLTEAEVNIYRAAAGNTNSAASVRKVLASMMASPNFYFVLERTQAGSKASCVTLTSQDLAAKLALHLWDSVADDALIADADNGRLLDSAVYQGHVTRMLADARSDIPLKNFFRQWFRLDELVAMDGKSGTPKFDAFAGDFKPLPTTKANAINEVLDMVAYQASHGGTLKDIITDRRSYARTADIAALYKTPVWDGQSTPPNFAEPARTGLLTRIAFVANGASDTTLPIQRGSKMLSALACESLPPPAMNQSNAQADLSGLLTTRERTQRVTEMPGTSCIGCHQSKLNPWGFALENFDSLGRYRASEIIRNDQGVSLGQKDIDATVMLKLGALAATNVSTAAQAQDYLLQSGQVEACFAKHYVRYTFGRPDGADDQAMMTALANKAASGAKLRDLFGEITLRSEFKTMKGAQ
jgi:Protein of unknown function (DUF1588)/Protein of unknown function (DUF1592)/Protein of unknown function (DUF1585)